MVYILRFGVWGLRFKRWEGFRVRAWGPGFSFWVQGLGLFRRRFRNFEVEVLESGVEEYRHKV